MCSNIWHYYFHRKSFPSLSPSLAQVPKELEQEGRILMPIPHEGPKWGDLLKIRKQIKWKFYQTLWCLSSSQTHCYHPLGWTWDKYSNILTYTASSHCCMSPPTANECYWLRDPQETPGTAPWPAYLQDSLCITLTSW